MSPPSQADALGQPDPRGPTPSGAIGALEAHVGSTVVSSEPARWGTSARTHLATLADGSRFAIQELDDRGSTEARVRRAARFGALLAAAGVPVPRVVLSDARAEPPYMVSEVAAGRTGAELLADPVDAIALGTEMGRLLRRVQSVPTDGLGLPSTWSDPRRLEHAAGRWLGAARSALDGETVELLAGVIGRLTILFAGRPAVLAHGDWAPVNVLVDGRHVTAVLDWEFARAADPLYDAAWWGWIVWHHHPDAYIHAWPAFLETAGIDAAGESMERLRSLGLLRLLEIVASRKVAGDPVSLARWTDRLRTTAFPAD